MGISAEVHEIFKKCEELDKKYNGFNDKSFTDIENPVERDFIVSMTNFFLKERQNKVIEKGFHF